MTVGIAINNGREAVAITDCRVSGGGRQSDSVDKMGHFNLSNFSGVIFGTGPANPIEGILRNLTEFKGENLDDYISGMQNIYAREVNEYRVREVAARKKDLEVHASLISDEKERAEFVRKIISDQLKELERNGRGALFSSQFPYF